MIKRGRIGGPDETRFIDQENFCYIHLREGVRSRLAEPDGSVTNCLDRGHPLGNVYRDDLSPILESPRMNNLKEKAASCSLCVDTGAIESSLFWDFHPEVMRNTLRFFLR